MRSIWVLKTSREVFDEEDVIRKLSDIMQGIKPSPTYFSNPLFGTYNILKQSGFPQATCLAGLFYFIYGSEVFEGGVNISREEVRELIGDVREELLHLFCSIRPRKQHILQNQEGLLSSWQQYHLAAIELAYLMEQKERIRWNTARDQYVAQLNSIIGFVENES